MDAEREAEVARIMARMAAGDGAAPFSLVDRFGAELTGAVRKAAWGRNVRLRADEVEDLVTDVVLALVPLAGAWDPNGGAPPWVWARHRVANVVDAHLGQHATSLDAPGAPELDEVAGPPVPPDRSIREVVAVLATRVPEVALLHEGVRRVASARDADLYFEVLAEQAGGNRAPADTVARLYGLKPEAVRQQSRRVRVRLRKLVASDPYFAPLADLAVGA